MGQPGRDLCAFPSWGGTQIEDPFVRLHIENLYCARCAWFLQIKCPCGMKRM